MGEGAVALVTGSNKGIGFEIAAGLAALGYGVVVGARDADRRAGAVERLTALGHRAFGVALDVTSDRDAHDAAAEIEQTVGRLDVLVNNAGTTGGWPQEPTRLTAATLQRAVDTNVVGTVRVTNAMLPLLRRAPSPRIVNISSGGASLARQTQTGGGWLSGAYAPSKTLLNAVTIQYAKELADTNILINVVNPGYTATDLTSGYGDRTPAEGARIAIQLATAPDGSPTGGFYEDEGPVPW